MGFILRYNPTTGALIDEFSIIPGGTTGITFGPDNNLYVAVIDASVLRFNYSTGKFMDVFVPRGSGGLSNPWHLTFEDARIVRPNN